MALSQRPRNDRTQSTSEENMTLSERPRNDRTQSTSEENMALSLRRSNGRIPSTFDENMGLSIRHSNGTIQSTSEENIAQSGPCNSYIIQPIPERITHEETTNSTCVPCKFLQKINSTFCSEKEVSQIDLQMSKSYLTSTLNLYQEKSSNGSSDTGQSVSKEQRNEANSNESNDLLLKISQNYQVVFHEEKKIEAACKRQSDLNRIKDNNQISIHKDRAEKEKEKDIRVYRINSSMNCKACIFNNQTFDILTERRGSDADVMNLEEMLKCLGFQTSVEENQTAKEMEEKIKIFAEMCKIEGTAAAFLAFLTHGMEGDVLFGKDGKVNIKEDKLIPVEGTFITQSYVEETFAELTGIPTILLYQACRGRKHCSECHQNAEPCVGKNNMIIINMTPPGYFAYRDAETGSPGIQMLAKTVSENDDNKEIGEMVDDAKKKLQLTPLSKGYIVNIHVRRHQDLQVFFSPSIAPVKQKKDAGEEQ